MCYGKIFILLLNLVLGKLIKRSASAKYYGVSSTKDSYIKLKPNIV